ncbi:hypothetical protein [Methylobrevis pamukkalensis]|uniref:NUDIX domain protein n=1 Tax=Methylobrevis pamukkalensis TaxID=1439726 RepID=A0A1E3H269_9HYPH|nr:hypothetical protein [Methylobrevis pamukkalensis]ODN70235.1 hypothetical protein A6302_02446 [Methylobrevis pamukkalensis]
MRSTAWVAPDGTPVTVAPIATVDLRLVSGSWTEDAALKARVAAHWAAEVARNPSLWNGSVLATRAPGRAGGLVLEAGVLRADAITMEFAGFVAWRDWGFPDLGFRNLFGSAVIQSSDGALFYGRMADWTANAGKVYPPGGSLEPRDLRADGTIDVIGSIETEMAEETGLAAAQAVVAGTYAVFDGPRVSVARHYRFRQTADELLAGIRAEIAGQRRSELSDMVVIRDAAALDPETVPGYALAIAETVLGPAQD